MSAEIRSLKLDIFTQEKADVYLSCEIWGKVAAQIVKRMDDFNVRVIGDVIGLPHDPERVRRIVHGCSGFVVLLPYKPLNSCTTDLSMVGDLRIAIELGLPLLILNEDGVVFDATRKDGVVTWRLGNSEQFTTAATRAYGPIKYDESSNPSQNDLVDAFLAEVFNTTDRIKPYAFYIGRLESDFAQAREAIRAAVENEAGIPLLWVDDGRHRTGLESLRQKTQLLLKYASFVVADLTLGIESPERENPSRAHEIGISIAYGRKLLLLSQEPRRYPYFSISDLQMIFWSTEEDLECKVKEWLRNHRDCLGQSIWNHRLNEVGHKPKVEPLQFRFNPRQRYVGPKSSGREWLRTAARRLRLQRFFI